MTVRFIGFDSTKDISKKFDNNLLLNRDYHFLLHNEYLVIGMRINTKAGITLECLDMYNHISFAPLDFFEILDSRVSSYWQLKVWMDGDISLYPFEFYENEYFNDDLSEGIPETVLKFQELIRKLKREHL